MEDSLDDIMLQPHVIMVPSSSVIKWKPVNLTSTVKCHSSVKESASKFVGIGWTL